MISPLATKIILSPNYSVRTSPITKFTPHHVAVADALAEAVAIGFQAPERRASANYIIGIDGTIICCVPEEYMAWTSSSDVNDNQAITVEVCNSTGAPEWKISDAALEALINLGADICRRYDLSGFKWTGDKNGTLTIHKMFVPTVCPGPYLESKMPYIAEEISKRIKEDKTMVYKINIDDLKKQGYTSVTFEFGAVTPEPVAPPKPTITEGATVKIKPGATDYNGGGLAAFVYNRGYKVSEINGDRAVITYNGTIVAAININDLILV